MKQLRGLWISGDARLNFFFLPGRKLVFGDCSATARAAGASNRQAVARRDTMTKCKGTIIEESLKDRAVLDELKIVSTKVLKVTERFQTPWLSQWTLHSVEIEPEKATETAELLSKSLEEEHDWYTDLNNGETFYVVFRNKVFTYAQDDREARQKAVAHGLSLGIPDYQLDFP